MSSLVMAEKSSTDIIVCLNKLDLAKGGLTEEIQPLYGDVYPVVCLSAESGKHIEELTEFDYGCRLKIKPRSVVVLVAERVMETHPEEEQIPESSI